MSQQFQINELKKLIKGQGFTDGPHVRSEDRTVPDRRTVPGRVLSADGPGRNFKNQKILDGPGPNGPWIPV